MQILIDSKIIATYILGTTEQRLWIETMYPELRWDVLKQQLLQDTLGGYADKKIIIDVFDVQEGKTVITAYEVNIKCLGTRDATTQQAPAPMTASPGGDDMPNAGSMTDGPAAN